MKRIILLHVFILFIGQSFAQDIRESNVPAVVLNSFQLKFPNAEDVRWTLNRGYYLVKCNVNDKRNEVTIDDRGRVLRHQQDLYFSEVPRVVLQAVRSRESVFEVSGAKRIESDGNASYEISYRIGGKRRYFMINEKGRIVKYRKDLNDAEIPASILNFVKTKIGSIDHIDHARYAEENGNEYYTLGVKGHVFLFNTQAEVLEHLRDLQESKLPAAVRKTIQESYNGYKVWDADMTDRRGVVTYRLRMGKSRKEVIVTLNPEGEILNTR